MNPHMQQILQMLAAGTNNQIRIGSGVKIKSRKQIMFNSQQQFQNLPLKIKTIYNAIFYQGNQQNVSNQKIQLQKVLNFKKVFTQMPICNRRLAQRQITFRCYDCMIHQASVICKSCFQNGNHKGHRYNQMQSGGGNCDCGNPDAIKRQGFCCNHKGSADPVIVDQKQQNNFLTIFLTLFQWILKLHQNVINKPADQLGQIVANYLVNLNQQSLYYNTLTYKLLYHPRLSNKNQIIINKILQCGIKCINFAKKMTNLFFTIFSLDIFKYQLTVSYCKAYNSIPNFQKSKFKDLYIQLFANNQLVQKLIKQEKIVLIPYQRQYEFIQYMQSLMFISTIKKQVAQIFFQFLFTKTVIQFPQLDLLQKAVQTQNRHIMEIINQNLNTQNSYYTLHESVLSLTKNNQNLIKIMIKNYIQIIIDQKYSYQKNKVVAPFHKILALLILVYFNGDIQSFNYKEIFYLFDLNQRNKVQKCFIKSFSLILKCYNQLSLTYFQSSYFDAYANLYIKSGNTTIIYDQLMFKICLSMFKQTQNLQQMNKVIIKIFQLNEQKLNQTNKQIQIQQSNNQMILQQSDLNNNLNNPIQNSNNQNQTQNANNMNLINSNSIDQQWQDDMSDQIRNEQQQFIEIKQQCNLKIQKKIIDQLKRKNQLIKIIIQNCITQRCDIKQCQSLQISNKSVSLKNQMTIAKLLNNFKQLTPQNLKLILRHFLQSKTAVQEQFIKKYLFFDKYKKKYIINTNFIQSISKERLPLEIYPSLKKIGDIFSVDQKKNLQENKKITVSKQAAERLNLFFNPYFVKKLCTYYIQNIILLNGNQEINQVFFIFYQLMLTLKQLKFQSHSQEIQQFFIEINKLAQKEQFKFLNNKLKEKTKQQLQRKKKQQIMKKFSQKKMKKNMQMKAKQQNFDYGQKIQEQQIQSLCIICRQDDKFQSLCFLANCKFNNILQILNLAQGQSLSFQSCFHPIHSKCFLKNSNQYDFIPCPLCKNDSNIMLPFEKQIENIQLIQQVYKRIIDIRLILKQSTPENQRKKIDQYYVLSILKSLSSAIGKVLVKNQQIFSQKNQRLYNIIYNVVTTLFRQILSKKDQKIQIQGIQSLLQIMKESATSDLSKTSNYYACEYLIISILYYCLIHQSDKCSDLLCQPIINSINRQDIKKIWQMCSQLVSLPQFKLRQSNQKQQITIKQMYEVVNFYKPPKNINELLQLRDSKMKCKNGHQICICLICQQKLCLQCQQVYKHFKKSHCGQGLSFNLLTGGFIYIIQKSLIKIPSLYINDFGIQWKPQKSIEGFTFDDSEYQQMIKQILNQSIMKYLLKKYPQLMKRNIIMENFF